MHACTSMHLYRLSRIITLLTLIATLLSIYCCKGSRRPIISLIMRTHNPQYARSEYHTQLAKVSFNKIFDLTAGVYVYFYMYMYNCHFFLVRVHLSVLALLSETSDGVGTIRPSGSRCRRFGRDPCSVSRVASI